MLESAVEKHLCKKVKEELHGRAFKWLSPGFNGVPDRIILIPRGRIYFVETKAPGKTLRARQKFVREIIQQLGFVVLRIDTKEKVEDFIRQVENCGI